MGKAVNKQSVVAAHYLSFATPVISPFHWIGQSVAYELLWISKHRGNRHDP